MNYIIIDFCFCVARVSPTEPIVPYIYPCNRLTLMKILRFVISRFFTDQSHSTIAEKLPHFLGIKKEGFASRADSEMLDGIKRFQGAYRAERCVFEDMDGGVQLAPFAAGLAHSHRELDAGQYFRRWDG